MKYLRIIFNEPIILITFLPSIFFLLIILLISKILLIKIGFLHSNRIGHFAANTELYLIKKKKFGIKSLDLFYLGRKNISNNYLEKLWRKKIIILPYELLRGLDLIIRATPLKKKFSCNYFSNTDRDLYGLYEKFPPTITVDCKDKRDLLEKFNLTKNDKIVCINVRDSEYLKTLYDPKYHNLSYHNFRDCKIENFELAINYLLKLNYKVFRVGVKKKTFLNISHQNYFDKTYSVNREDSTDILLAENCNFCISVGSGFDALPRLFRKPILFVNFIPIINYHSFCKKDLTICKHLYQKDKISIENIFKKKLYGALTEFYKNNNLQVIENTPEEILAATKEMVLRIENNFNLKAENLKYQNLIKNKIKEASHGNFLHGNLLADFGEEYIKKNYYD